MQPKFKLKSAIYAIENFAFMFTKPAVIPTINWKMIAEPHSEYIVHASLNSAFRA